MGSLKHTYRGFGVGDHLTKFGNHGIVVNGHHDSIVSR